MTKEQENRLTRITSRFRELSQEFHTTLMDLDDLRKDGHEDYKNLFRFDPMSNATREQFMFVQQLDEAMGNCKVEEPFEKFISELYEILI